MFRLRVVTVAGLYPRVSSQCKKPFSWVIKCSLWIVSVIIGLKISVEKKNKAKVIKKGVLLVPPVKLVKLTLKSPTSLAVTGLGVSHEKV